MGNFNINLLNSNIDKNTSDYVGTLHSQRELLLTQKL